MTNASVFAVTTDANPVPWEVSNEIEQVYRTVLRPALSAATVVHLYGKPESFRLDESESDESIVVRRGSEIQLDVRKDLVTDRPYLWNAKGAGSIAIVCHMNPGGIIEILRGCTDVGTMSVREQKRAFAPKAIAFADRMTRGGESNQFVLLTSSTNAIQAILIYGSSTEIDTILQSVHPRLEPAPLRPPREH